MIFSYIYYDITMTYLFLKLYINSIDGNVDVKFREKFNFFLL